MKLKICLLASASLILTAAHATAQVQTTPPDTTTPNQNAAKPAQQSSDNSTADSSAVVVRGYRASLRSAQKIKQRSDAILDAVVAEDIGKLPDVNAAESLARLPGVQISHGSDEGSGVLVRGLPDVATTVNGRDISTAELRRVQLQDFPSGALAGMEVYKSGTADLLEPGLAGLINVRTRRPFDFKGFEIDGAIRETYNDQNGKFNTNGNVLLTDRWSTSHGDIGALLNLSYTEQDYRNARMAILGRAA
ncbi:MAG: TonB-dependent receptor plug domain-containing protein [Asticcacaulis sp.]|nr:TonB-dependent receptor plug domain-containing protein [Asticcacaulis sp.]